MKTLLKKEKKGLCFFVFSMNHKFIFRIIDKAKNKKEEMIFRDFEFAESYFKESIKLA